VAKLYFRYGTMDSAKSMNLLAVAHNYRKQGKRVLLMKPRLDTRFGSATITSRCGTMMRSKFVVNGWLTGQRNLGVGTSGIVIGATATAKVADGDETSPPVIFGRLPPLVSHAAAATIAIAAHAETASILGSRVIADLLRSALRCNPRASTAGFSPFFA